MVGNGLTEWKCIVVCWPNGWPSSLGLRTKGVATASNPQQSTADEYRDLISSPTYSARCKVNVMIHLLVNKCTIRMFVGNLFAIKLFSLLYWSNVLFFNGII